MLVARKSKDAQDINWTSKSGLQIRWSFRMVAEVPKPRLGKVMRRISRKIFASQIDQDGNTTTLVIPSVVGDKFFATV